MFDIKITGGNLLDGTGGPATRHDVGICGDRIEAVGNLSASEARVAISAVDRIVCPGFVDVHSHSDGSLLVEPSVPSKIHQGVTTEVVGNCGASAAPLTARTQIPSDWQTLPYPGDWHSVAEYRALLESTRPAPNVVFLVGHGTLRKAVAGGDNRPVTSAELDGMKRLLEQSLAEGARGMSTGLIYAPSRFADRGELVDLARIVAGHGGIYASHMRNEGTGLIEAIQEALALGEVAGLPVQISHLKTSGRASWSLLDRALDLIRSARQRGMPVAADRYPYTSSYTDLDMLFPDWAAEGGREAVLARLADPSTRARLRADLVGQRSPEYWPTVTIGSTRHPENHRFRGRLLVDVAREMGMEPADAVIHFARTDELSTTAFFAGMSEENMFRILAEPYVMIGSDASARAPTGPLGQDYPHPRAYGTFPRFLRMVLDGRSVSLPDAIRKMTSLPAAHFQLKDRGVIARGRKADVTVWDPLRIRDLATYGAPHQLAEGMDHVIINGVLTLTDGHLTGGRAGRFL